MMRLNIRRDSWQFVELMERWGWARNTDLKRLIQRGELLPYATFARELHPTVMVDGLPVVEEHAIAVHADLWVVQSLSVKVDTHDHYYRFLATVPNWTCGEDGQLWALPEPVSTDGVLLTFVVADENRIAVEQAYNERATSQRSQDVKDRLLVTLALDRFSWKQNKDIDFGGLTEVIDATNAYGIPVSYNAAKTNLRELVERIKPTDLSRPSDPGDINDT